MTYKPLTDTVYPIGPSVSYIIDGNPIPSAHVRPINKGRIWDAQRHLKMFYRSHLERLHNDRPFYEGPLHVQAYFYMPIAHCHRKRADEMIDTYHIFRPDTSNMLKFIEDIGNDILYKDDCIISSIWTKKVYDKKVRTEFIITPIKA